MSFSALFSVSTSPFLSFNHRQRYHFQPLSRFVQSFFPLTIDNTILSSPFLGLSSPFLSLNHRQQYPFQSLCLLQSFLFPSIIPSDYPLSLLVWSSPFSSSQSWLHATLCAPISCCLFPFPQASRNTIFYTPFSFNLLHSHLVKSNPSSSQSFLQTTFLPPQSPLHTTVYTPISHSLFSSPSITLQIIL